MIRMMTDVHNPHQIFQFLLRLLNENRITTEQYDSMKKSLDQGVCIDEDIQELCEVSRISEEECGVMKDAAERAMKAVVA